jgi:hypothetical protein
MEDKLTQYQYIAAVHELIRASSLRDDLTESESGKSLSEIIKIVSDHSDVHSILDSVKTYTEYMDGSNLDNKSKTVLTRLIKLEKKVIQKIGSDNDYVKAIKRIRSSYKKDGLTKNDIIILNNINKLANNIA